MAAPFCWYELITTDPAAAQTFYRHVLGWGAEQMDDYTLLNAGGPPLAGLMAIPDDAKKMGVGPCWTGYIAVPDVDAGAQQVVAKGGAVRRPGEDIPGVGRFAVVADPQGAVFILFTPAPNGMAPPPASTNTPGHVAWRELMSSDAVAGFDFYAGLFGWTKGEGHEMGAHGVYQLFEIDGVPAGGMMKKPDSVPASFWTYYFAVDDIDAAAERVKAGGGAVINGPMEVPGGDRVLQATDPQGAMFALSSSPG